MVVTPGPPAGPPQSKAGALIADEAALSRLDPINHRAELIADAQGRITLPALIPGATYRIMDRTTYVAQDVGDGPQVRKEFVVGPGEAVELGDVRIEKPRETDQVKSSAVLSARSHPQTRGDREHGAV